MGHSWISIAGWLLLIVTFAISFIKGEAAEKFGATLLLVSYVASDLVIALTYPHPPQIVLFLLDLFLATGLLILAIKYNSLWLGGAMILQSIALLAHGVRLSYEGVDTYTWMALNNLISLMMMLCIIAASLLSWRARSNQRVPAVHYVADPA